MTRRSRSTIVFLHPSDELYGADRMLLEMVAAVPAAERAHVEVWLPDDLEHPAPDLALCTVLDKRGVAVRHLSLPIMRRAYQNPRGLLRLVMRMGRLHAGLRASRPALVYCTTSAAFLGAPVARLAGVPRVLGHVQEIWSRLDSVVLAAPGRTCHQVLCISDAVAGSLPRALRRRTTVVPNGVPRPDRGSSLDGRRGPLSFVVASRWNGWKGHRTLLRAWEQAGAPGTLLVLGGPPRSGDRVDVPALVSQLSHPERVQVVGEVDDPSDHLEAADVMVVPSDQPEPFGLVAIEAFARGRPVVASAGGGLLDIVTPGHDGWSFPPGDADALAAVLAGLDRPTVNAAGRQALHTYELRFTAARFATSWRRVVLPTSREA